MVFFENNMQMDKKTVQDIPDQQKLLEAREVIQSYVHRTPVLTCSTLDQITGATLYFKCENFQKGGAFKFRGASHAVMTLPKDQLSKGVATHSSGNHAQALSLAARMRRIKAHVVMPENAPRIKVAAVEQYGGNIRFCAPTLPDREATLEKVVRETGAAEIHPYNDYRIIAGQASVAAEIYEEVTRPDILLVPVGGGGLLSGSILSTRYFSPGTRVYAAEPEKADDALQSFRQGRFVPADKPQTIADGLRTSLGSKTYPIIMEGVTDILTASEDSIACAMRLIWERMKIVVEPSAAVPLACIMDNPVPFRNRRTAIIISGGNADLMNLPWMNQATSIH